MHCFLSKYQQSWGKVQSKNRGLRGTLGRIKTDFEFSHNPKSKTSNPLRNLLIDKLKDFDVLEKFDVAKLLQYVN